MAKIFYLGGGTHSRGMLRAVVTIHQLEPLLAPELVTHLGHEFPDVSEEMPASFGAPIKFQFIVSGRKSADTIVDAIPLPDFHAGVVESAAQFAIRHLPPVLTQLAGPQSPRDRKQNNPYIIENKDVTSLRKGARPGSYPPQGPCLGTRNRRGITHILQYLSRFSVTEKARGYNPPPSS